MPARPASAGPPPRLAMSGIEVGWTGRFPGTREDNLVNAGRAVSLGRASAAVAVDARARLDVITVLGHGRGQPAVARPVCEEPIA